LDKYKIEVQWPEGFNPPRPISIGSQ
jgi:hypothetical protein